MFEETLTTVMIHLLSKLMMVCNLSKVFPFYPLPVGWATWPTRLWASMIKCLSMKNTCTRILPGFKTSGPGWVHGFIYQDFLLITLEYRLKPWPTWWHRRTKLHFAMGAAAIATCPVQVPLE